MAGFISNINKGIIPLQNFGAPQTGGTTTSPLAFQTPKPTTPPSQSYPSLQSGNFNTTTSLPQTSGLNNPLIQNISGYKPPSTSGLIAPPKPQITETSKPLGQGGTYSGPVTQVPQTPPSLNSNPYQSQAPSFSGAVGALASTAAQPSPLFTQAGNQALDYQRQLNELRQQEAQGIGNIERSGGTPMSQAMGEEGAINRLYAARENALAKAFAGSASLLPSATGQQSVQQSGLGTAAGLAAPQLAGLTNVPFNPVTGQFGGVSGAQGGNIGGASQVLGQLGSGQNFYANLVPAFNQAQSVYQGFNNFLQQNPDINPSALNKINFADQWIKGQFSSPKYQQFGQFLNELLQTLTPIVGSQGVSDYKQQLVQSMVNPTASNQSIQQQIQSLMSIAQGKMEATQQSFSSPQPFQANAPSNSSIYNF